MELEEKCVKQLGSYANDSLTGERRFSGSKVRVFQLQRAVGPQATQAGRVFLGIAQYKLSFVDPGDLISYRRAPAIALACYALHRLSNKGRTGFEHSSGTALRGYQIAPAQTQPAPARYKSVGLNATESWCQMPAQSKSPAAWRAAHGRR